MVNKYYKKKLIKTLREKARERFSEEEKEKKHQYHRYRTRNLSEEEKQKKIEYMRNYYLTHKNNF